MKILLSRAACAAAALVLTCTIVLPCADAYAPTPHQQHQQLTPLQPRTASRRFPTSLDAIGKRREIFGWLKKAAVLGMGFKTVLADPAKAAAAAQDDAAVNGRVITFQVNNLGGEEGKVGTVKIQMAPTWAPRGVARFEVRECAIVR